MNTQYNIYIYDNEKLVDYAQKIGHMGAAEIIKKLHINGQEFMELSDLESVQWKLTRLEQNVLKQCIARIKSKSTLLPPSPKSPIKINISTNEAFKEKLGEVLKAKLPSIKNKDKEEDPSQDTTNNEANSRESASYINFDEIALPEYSTENIAKRKPHPIPRYIKRCREYFKFKKYSKRKFTDSEECLLNTVSFRLKDSEVTYPRNSRDSFYSCSSSIEMVPSRLEPSHNSLSLLSDTSSYIYPPTLQQKRENLTVERIKKYVQVNNVQPATLKTNNLYDEVIRSVENLSNTTLEESQESRDEEDANLTEITYDEDKGDQPVCNCGIGLFKYSCIFTCQASD